MMKFSTPTSKVIITITYKVRHNRFWNYFTNCHLYSMRNKRDANLKTPKFGKKRYRIKDTVIIENLVLQSFLRLIFYVLLINWKVKIWNFFLSLSECFFGLKKKYYFIILLNHEHIQFFNKLLYLTFFYN